MDTIVEILRRVRFLWALCWIAATVALAIYSPAILPWRIGAPTLAWVALYLTIPGPFRAALCWVGVSLSLALAVAMGRGGAASSDAFAFIFVVAPAGAVLILVASFLLAPLFRRRT